MTHPVILEEDFRLLKTIIGKRISFAVAPDVVVSRQHYSCLGDINSNSLLTFYHSSPITLCISDKSEEDRWVALDAGPDTADEPWAPFAAWKVLEPIKTCLFGEIKYPNGWIINENEIDERPARLELWTDSAICKIKIHRLGVYAAMTCEHYDGVAWSAYAEYDRMFWLSFDRDVISAIEAQGDDFITV